MTILFYLLSLIEILLFIFWHQYQNKSFKYKRVCIYLTLLLGVIIEMMVADILLEITGIIEVNMIIIILCIIVTRIFIQFLTLLKK